jgi:hypothetical protein
VCLLVAVLSEVVVVWLGLQVWQQLRAWRVGGAAQWLLLAVAAEAVVRSWSLARQESGPAGLGWLLSVLGACAVVYVVWRVGQYLAEQRGAGIVWPRAEVVLEKTQEEGKDE